MFMYFFFSILWTGTYAFRTPDDNGDGGIWVSYEDPDTAGNKAGFVRQVKFSLKDILFAIVSRYGCVRSSNEH